MKHESIFEEKRILGAAAAHAKVERKETIATEKGEELGVVRGEARMVDEEDSLVIPQVDFNFLFSFASCV